MHNFVYARANSLLPPRDPEPAEEAPTEAAVISPVGQQLIDLMVALGWSPAHAASYYRSLFTYFWYTVGIHDVAGVNARISAWISTHLAPAVARVRGAQPAGLPPQAIYFAVVVGIALVIILLVAPEFEDRYTWVPPCNLYLGTYNEQLWWFTLVAVSLEQIPIYRAVSYSGAVITARTYEYITPPTVTDRLHFWGTLIFECWQIPWYRQYRALWADCEYLGLLSHITAELYALRQGGHDPWAPRGPIVIPVGEQCLTHSPCG